MKLLRVVMKKMVLLSVLFHALLFVGLVFPALIWPKHPVPPPVHRVELVSLPQTPVRQPKVMPAVRPRPVQKKAVKKKVEPVKPKVKQAEKPVKKAKPPVKKAAEEAKPTPKAQVPPPTQSEEPAVEKEETPQMEVAKKEVPSGPSVQISDVKPVLKKEYSEYEFYHALIAMKIKERWSPPPTGRQAERMEAVVAFTLTRSGRISGNVRLVQSSGNPFYDQAALRATLGTLPPPPPGYPEELLEMKLVYVLDTGYLN